MDFGPDEPASGVPLALSPGPSQPRPVSVIEALGFAFESPSARRDLLVGSLWLCVPVFGWAAVRGWVAESERRMLREHPAPLPPLRLGDFAYYARAGLGIALLELSGLSLMTGLLAALLIALNFGALAALVSGAGLVTPLLVLAAIVVLEIGLLGAGTVLLNAALTRAELSGRAATALSPRETLRHARRSIGRTVLAYFVFVPVALVVLSLGAALCGVGVLPALIVTQAAASHLRIQLYRRHVALGGKRIDVLPPAELPSERRELRRLPRTTGRER